VSPRRDRIEAQERRDSRRHKRYRRKTDYETINVVRDNLFSMVELAQIHTIRAVLASLLPLNDYSKRPVGDTSNQHCDLSNSKLSNEWIKGMRKTMN
jgi:hypothetical protein